MNTEYMQEIIKNLGNTLVGMLLYLWLPLRQKIMWVGEVITYPTFLDDESPNIDSIELVKYYDYREELKLRLWHRNSLYVYGEKYYGQLKILYVFNCFALHFILWILGFTGWLIIYHLLQIIFYVIYKGNGLSNQADYFYTFITLNPLYGSYLIFSRNVFMRHYLILTSTSIILGLKDVIDLLLLIKKSFGYYCSAAEFAWKMPYLIRDSVSILLCIVNYVTRKNKDFLSSLSLFWTVADHLDRMNGDKLFKKLVKIMPSCMQGNVLEAQAGGVVQAARDANIIMSTFKHLMSFKDIFYHLRFYYVSWNYDPHSDEAYPKVFVEFGYYFKSIELFSKISVDMLGHYKSLQGEYKHFVKEHERYKIFITVNFNESRVLKDYGKIQFNKAERLLEKLSTFKDTSSGIRQFPITLVMTGAPDIGKSMTLMPNIITSLITCFNPNYRYATDNGSLSLQNGFYCGLNQYHESAIADDLYANTTTQNSADASKPFNDGLGMFNTTPFYLNKASMSEKGDEMRTIMNVFLSNSFPTPTYMKKQERIGLARRLHCMDVRLHNNFYKPTVEKDTPLALPSEDLTGWSVDWDKVKKYSESSVTKIEERISSLTKLGIQERETVVECLSKLMPYEFILNRPNTATSKDYAGDRGLTDVINKKNYDPFHLEEKHPKIVGILELWTFLFHKMKKHNAEYVDSPYKKDNAIIPQLGLSVSDVLLTLGELRNKKVNLKNERKLVGAVESLIGIEETVNEAQSSKGDDDYSESIPLTSTDYVFDEFMEELKEDFSNDENEVDIEEEKQDIKLIVGSPGGIRKVAELFIDTVTEYVKNTTRSVDVNKIFQLITFLMLLLTCALIMYYTIGDGREDEEEEEIFNVRHAQGGVSSTVDEMTPETLIYGSDIQSQKEMWSTTLDKNAVIIMDMDGSRIGQALGIGGKEILLPEHYLRRPGGVMRKTLDIARPGHGPIRVKIKDCLIFSMGRPRQETVDKFDLPDDTVWTDDLKRFVLPTKFPITFRNIEKRFVSEESLGNISISDPVLVQLFKGEVSDKVVFNHLNYANCRYGTSVYNLTFPGEVSEYKMRRRLSYRIKNGKGMCGSLIFGSAGMCRDVLIGFHINGSPNGNCGAIVVTREMIEDSRSEAQSGVNEEFAIGCAPLVREAFTSPICRSVFYKSAQTYYRNEPYCYNSWEVKNGEPIQVKKDTRNYPTKIPTSVKSKMVDGRMKHQLSKKFGKFRKIVFDDYNKEALEMAEEDLRKRYLTLAPGKMRDWTFYMLGDGCYLTGLNRTSSSGPPLIYGKYGTNMVDKKYWLPTRNSKGVVHKPPGTNLFIKLCQELFDKLENETIENECVCFTKSDETLPRLKVDNNDSRPIYASSNITLTVGKALFSDLIIEASATKIDNNTAIGANPYGNDWGKMYEKLGSSKRSKRRRFLETDISGQEYNMYHPRIKEKLINIVMSWYKDAEDGLNNKRRNYLVSLFDVVVNYDGIYYKGMDINASGHLFTTFLNSLVLELWKRYCWYDLVDQEKESMLFYRFDDYVSTITNGDDSLDGVDEDVTNMFYNVDRIVSFYERHGITITSADKDDEIIFKDNLATTTFLKRTPKIHQSDGKVVGALDPESILNSLMWSKSKKHCVAASLQNAKAQLVEASMHSEEFYSYIYGIVRHRFLGKDNSGQLEGIEKMPSYKECVKFRYYQLNGKEKEAKLFIQQFNMEVHMEKFRR